MQDTIEKLNCVCCFSNISSYPCPECGFNREEYQPDPIVLPIGSVLQDRYVIGGVIGKGGFGITYLAYDKKLERKIAVKEYYPYGLALRTTEDTSVFISGDDGVFNKGADKFYNEAKMIARFNSSPNIVNIFDFFYENCTVYYVMEYLRGRTLRSYVENIGCLTPGQAVYIALEISDALTTTHSESILHRDISPDNIMLCSDGKVKLIDFGAARQVASEYSKSLSVILTQGFAPLEQYQKKGKQGPWTDIYSLGAALYYGLTGCVLDDPMSRLENDTEFEKNPFSVNEELWTVIKKAVMLKIANRHESAAQFRDDLEKLSISPEKVKISEAQIKDTLKRISRSDSGKAQSGTLASKTMPAKSSSQMQTMPVNSSSQMRTMPVSNSSQIRTMPIYDETSDKARSKTPHETANSVRNKFIPIVSVLSTVVVMLIIGIIVMAIRDDEKEIVYVGADSASVSTAYDETEPEESSGSETETSPMPAANEQPEPSEPEPSEPKTSEPEKPEPETPEKDKPEGSSRPDRTETEPSAAPQPQKDEKPKKDVTEAPEPVTEAPKPVTEAPKPVTEAPKPVTEAPKPTTQATKTTTTAKAPKSVETKWTAVSDSNLKISYKVPDGFLLDSDSNDDWRYYKNTETNVYFEVSFMNIVGEYPICSYKDMPGFIDKYLDLYYPDTLNGGKGKDMTIAGRSAWAYELTYDYKGKTFYWMDIFCDSKTKCGCYNFTVGYLAGDSKSEAVASKFLDTIAITGTPEAFRTKGMDICRGDRGANALGLSADVGFFYNAPGYKLTGDDGETLYIGDLYDNHIDITATPKSIKQVCDYYSALDINKLKTVKYGDNTFYFCDEYFEDGNEKIHSYEYLMKIDDYTTLEISTWNADSVLINTLEKDILPSIYVYSYSKTTK